MFLVLMPSRSRCAMAESSRWALTIRTDSRQEFETQFARARLRTALGSAYVSRASFDVPPRRTSCKFQTAVGFERLESSRSRGRARRHAGRVRYPTAVVETSGERCKFAHHWLRGRRGRCLFLSVEIRCV